MVEQRIQPKAIDLRGKFVALDRPPGEIALLGIFRTIGRLEAVPEESFAGPALLDASRRFLKFTMGVH